VGCIQGENIKAKREIVPRKRALHSFQVGKADLKGNEIANREQGVRMIRSGRADYCLVKLVQLSDTLDLLPGSRDAFECGEIFSDTLSMLFTKNNRRRKLRDFYDEEIEGLAKTDALARIYENWGSSRFVVGHFQK
jgi:ABC-type amino acid transport substrate-binding protein